MRSSSLRIVKKTKKKNIQALPFRVTQWHMTKTRGTYKEPMKMPPLFQNSACHAKRAFSWYSEFYCQNYFSSLTDAILIGSQFNIILVIYRSLSFQIMYWKRGSFVNNFFHHLGNANLCQCLHIYRCDCHWSILTDSHLGRGNPKS